MGHVGEDMRICDEVSKWVKSLQSKLKESGDLLLEDIEKASRDNKVVEFVKNEEFYKLLSKDKVGYLNMRRSPKEFKLQLLTKVPSLKDGAVVEFSIEADKISVEELPDFNVEATNNDKKVKIEKKGAKFSFPVSVGDYTCYVTWHGQHISGSPLSFPVIPDVIADLKELGLAPLDTSSSKDIQVGSKCFAKWAEDNVWYNASIEGDNEDGSCQVLFMDYGNSDKVSASNIVQKSEMIPKGDDVDENVLLTEGTSTEAEVLPSKFSINDLVVAKWSEDGMWYNAKILSIQDAKANVLFVDYGNEAQESVGNLVKDVSDIPATDQEFIDENVSVVTVVKAEKEKEVPTIEEESRIELKVGDEVITKWSEDDVWYNAKIVSVAGKSARVHFVDYGNEEEEDFGRIVRCFNDIPKDELNSIDENVQPSKDPPSPNEASHIQSISEAAAESPKVSVLVEKFESRKEVSPKQEVPAASNGIKIRENLSFANIENLGPLLNDELKPGTVCVAKWDEDETYYNAKVLKYSAESGQYEVEFTDYGNTANVSRLDIVMSGNDVPPGQDYDTNVVIEDLVPGNEEVDSLKPTSVTFNVGEKCFAKWSEDETWYNAEIISVDDDEYQVKFVDYGNEDKTKFIAKKVSDIPVSDIIDECVDSKSEDQAVTLEESPQPLPSTSGSVTEKQSTCSPPVDDLGVGEKCFAKWSEDDTWYNAEVLAVHPDGYQVLFVDYGNEDKTKVVVKKVSEIATSEAIDENVDTKSLNQVSTSQSNENHAKSEVSEVVDKPVEITASEAPSKVPTSNESSEKKLNTVVKEKETTVQNSNPALSSSTLKKEASPPKKPSSANVSPAKPSGENLTAKKEGNWKVGDACFAKWSEDDTWYNAEVVAVLLHGYFVNFVDYGNKDETKLIVKKVSEIPASETIDENVDTKSLDQVSTSPSNNTHVEFSSISSPEKEIPTTMKSSQANVTPVKPSGDNPTTPATKAGLWEVGDVCFARWDEDQVWYNAKIIQISSEGRISVIFSDYGNDDQVTQVVRKWTEIPADANVDENVAMHSVEDTTVDNNKDSNIKIVKTESSNSSDSGVGDSILGIKTNFLSFVEKKNAQEVGLIAKKKTVIKQLNGPVAVAMLNSETLALVCRNDQSVHKYSRSGKPLGLIKISNRDKFKLPSDICVLKSGKFVIRDGNGLHMFGPNEKYLGKLGPEFSNLYFGIAEAESHIVTINVNKSGNNPRSPTEKNEVDLFYFDKETHKLDLRIEMADIITHEMKPLSQCSNPKYRYLTYDEENKKLYVVDMGLDCVYCLFKGEDGEFAGGSFGDSGSMPNQFNKPAGMVVDDMGSLIVVDSGNNRLQVVDSNWNICGALKVDRPLVRPSGVFFDKENTELWVCNYGDGSVVCYSIKM